MPRFYTKFKSKLDVEYEILSTDDYVFVPSDFYGLVAIFSDPAVYEFISKDVLDKYYPDCPFVEPQALDFLRFSKIHWEKGEQYRFLIRRLENKALVGYINIEPRDADVPERSLAKVSSEPGFMSQALGIVLEFAKEMGYAKTFGLVSINNNRMQEFAKKLRMQEAGKVMENGKEFYRYEIVV